MTSLPKAQSVTFSGDSLTLELTDGRTISVPIAWYPRLTHATTEERRHWRLLGTGIGVQWPDLDEDISVQSLLAGRRSGESQQSLDKWLKARKAKAG